MSSATINLATGVATATGNITEITPWNTNEYYHAMIVPQTVNSNTNLVSISVDGRKYTYTTDADMEFIAGTQHKIEVTISAPSNSGLIVNFSIKAWNVDDNIYGGEAAVNPGTTPTPANNEIWYTSTYEDVVAPYSGQYNNNATILQTFGADIVSNIYNGDVGIITFDSPIYSIGKSAFYQCDMLTSIIIV